MKETARSRNIVGILRWETGMVGETWETGLGDMDLGDMGDIHVFHGRQG